MVLVPLNIHMQRVKLDLTFTTHTKIKSKRIEDLNVRPKLLKQNTGMNFHNLEFVDEFFKSR